MAFWPRLKTICIASDADIQSEIVKTEEVLNTTLLDSKAKPTKSQRFINSNWLQQGQSLNREVGLGQLIN